MTAAIWAQSRLIISYTVVYRPFYGSWDDEFTSAVQPSVIVLLGPGYGAVPVTQVVPTQGAVSYGNYVLCQPSFTHLQLPMQPITSTMTTSTGFWMDSFPFALWKHGPKRRATDVPSDSEEECNQSRRSTKNPPMPSASTARRLRRKRAAERAKVANASAAPQAWVESRDMDVLLSIKGLKVVYCLMWMYTYIC